MKKSMGIVLCFEVEYGATEAQGKETVEEGKMGKDTALCTEHIAVKWQILRANQ